MSQALEQAHPYFPKNDIFRYVFRENVFCLQDFYYLCTQQALNKNNFKYKY